MNPTALASILVNIIAPIVLVAAVGYILGRAFDLDARSLSRLTLYFFTPALTFASAYRSELGQEFFAIAAFAFLITLLMGIVTLAMILLRGYDRNKASAFALSVLFVNAGNYGLPLILFAFGQEALALAVIFFTASTVLIQTLAVFIAARGTASATAAVTNVFKMPLVYAVVLGLVFNEIGFTVPDPIMKSVDLVAGAAVPVMIAILGIELSRATLQQDRFDISLAAVAKLVITPLLAFGLAAWMGMSGIPRAVCILEASMPTAVMSSILAVEFKSRPEFVTGTVLVTTLGSIVSLTLLLGILR
ncbi:MAG: AEC family transporter [Chloroflexi bacterium]|nr:AEC family transporter [Chloroflexota bacterium]